MVCSDRPLWIHLCRTIGAQTVLQRWPNTQTALWVGTTAKRSGPSDQRHTSRQSKSFNQRLALELPPRLKSVSKHQAGRQPRTFLAGYTAAVILLIDNYDSFTYNLVQRIGELDASLDLRVVRNDKITADEAESLTPDRVIISPGPCTPNEGGISNQIIERFAGQVPLLGVCLGHQCIGFTHGMTVERNDKLMHGKTSPIHHDGRGLFEGLSNPFTATRYHSLIVDPEGMDADFEPTAWTTDQEELMGLRSKTHPTEGVQFHPESIASEHGHDLLNNFLKTTVH